jgi:ammonia channel protein AmtB
LIIGSIVAIAIGTMLWTVVGPAVVMMGNPTRTSEDHRWSFFQAYSWLSYPPSNEEISSTISSAYWLGFAVSIIGISIVTAGVAGIILAAVIEMCAHTK